jgi:hypothetical protein
LVCGDFDGVPSNALEEFQGLNASPPEEGPISPSCGKVVQGTGPLHSGPSGLFDLLDNHCRRLYCT